MRRVWFKSIGIVTARGERLKFVGIIATAIVVTLFQTLVPVIKIRPLDEYRKPAPVPDIIGKIAHGDGRIAGDINAWFDDRMGFRSILTRVANQIDYSIFGYSKKVLIGKDGWLFDPDLFTAALTFSRANGNLAAEREKIVAIAESLKRRNIRLVVISTPAKETVYREFLPTRTPLGPATSEFEKFRNYLKARDGYDWIYIDSQEIFMGAKNDGKNLYHRTDVHSTTYGTILIAKALVNRMAESEHADWRWDLHLELFPEDTSLGSNMRFLSVFSYRKEEILEPHTRYYYPSNPPPGGIFEKPAQPFEVVFHSQTGHPTLPRTVLFGSSFLDRLLLIGAYSYFKDVYRVRGTSDQIGQALQAIPPGTRYFVFQFWEPHLALLRQAQIPSD
jgi:hypothetical protein